MAGAEIKQIVFQVNHIVPAYKASRKSWNHDTFFLKIRAKLAYHRDQLKKADLDAKRVRGEAPPPQKKPKKDKTESTSTSGARLFAAAKRTVPKKKAGRPRGGSGGKKTSKTDYELISDNEDGSTEASFSRKRKVRTLICLSCIIAVAKS
jgi:hypothetical protein